MKQHQKHRVNLMINKQQLIGSRGLISRFENNSTPKLNRSQSQEPTKKPLTITHSGSATLCRQIILPTGTFCRQLQFADDLFCLHNLLIS